MFGLPLECGGPYSSTHALAHARHAPRLQDEAVAARVQLLLSTPRFRCYRSTDVAGVEMGGALKNVLAIACGAVRCGAGANQGSPPMSGPAWPALAVRVGGHGPSARRGGHVHVLAA